MNEQLLLERAIQLDLPRVSPLTPRRVVADLVDQIGPTWGDYIDMLSDNAAYLGRLGLHVIDVSDHDWTVMAVAPVFV